MWTLLWLGELDGWDRLETKEEVEEMVVELIDKGYSPEDMLVFPPDADCFVPDWNGGLDC